MRDLPPVILLVEDEVDLLQVLATALGHARPGWQIAATRSVREADEKLAEMDRDGQALGLAVVDYRLGRSDGLGILLQVRQRHPDAPAMMVTGQAPAEAEREARSVGARVLWKPLDLGQFLSTVDELLAG